MLDKLITHLLELFWASGYVVLARGCAVSSLSLSLPIYNFMFSCVCNNICLNQVPPGLHEV